MPKHVPKVVRIRLDGRPLELVVGQSLAAALANQGLWELGEPGAQARQVICAMGVCFACCVRVNGETRRACRVRVEADMRVELGGGTK